MANNDESARDRAEWEYFDGAEETEANYRRFNDYRAGYNTAEKQTLLQVADELLASIDEALDAREVVPQSMFRLYERLRKEASDE